MYSEVLLSNQESAPSQPPPTPPHLAYCIHGPWLILEALLK